MSPKRILGLVIAASALASSAALAATGTSERVRATIAAATTDSATVDTYADKPVTLTLKEDITYLKVEKSNQRKYAPRVSEYRPRVDESDAQSLGPAISPGWPQWFSQ